jgi:hypothetical protein
MSKRKKQGLGRPSIFRGKVADDGTLQDGAKRVQGVITPVGTRRFEQSRARLAKLADLEVEQVSDADVIEFLARGETNTRRYLAGRTP